MGILSWMGCRMEPCQQENRITRIENAVGEIGEKVNNIAADVSVIREKIDGVTRTVEEHDRALYGNNGGVGVVAKVVQSVETLEDLKIALKGKGEEPGLISDIRTLMDWMGEWKDGRKWINRLLVGLAVAEVFRIILEVMK